MARQWNFDFFFVIRVYYEKLGHMLKNLVTMCRPDLKDHVQKIYPKNRPREAETDSSWLVIVQFDIPQAP